MTKSKKGKLIVFEGADGSGKTTQSKLLVSYFSNPSAGGKIPNAYISFPRYESSMWAQMVRRYLQGEFGGVDDVDPYLISALYAGDRLSAALILRKWIDEGKIVVANRYVWSNAAHMGAKFKSENERRKYIEWLLEFEYGEKKLSNKESLRSSSSNSSIAGLKIPKEDIVLFLHVPVSVSRKLMVGKPGDIHEDNLGYLEKVVTVYERLASERKNWETIGCTENGRILPPGEIHKKILEVLKRRKIVA